MGYATTLQRVILPQAARIAVPPLSNTFISLVKDTSLASTILVTELLRVAQLAAAPTFDFFALYGVAAVYYWVICLILSFAQNRLETRLERYVRALTDLLTVRGVRKAFGELEVLRDISFDVPAGTVTAVIGPSGSGKTTVLRTLNALDRADAGVIGIGDVSVDFGAPVDRATLARFRAQSGMVFQAHNLFPHKTVLQNVIEGPVIVQKRPKAEAIADARRLLDAGGVGREGRPVPVPALGRPAAAGRDRPRAGAASPS